MIGRISGILLEKNPPQLLIDCQGMGYEVDVPMSTFYQLPATGEKITLYTHLVVREDAHLLYGFMTTSERSLFRQLIRISGIGARIALAVLSGMSVNDVSQAIVVQDTARLTQIPGIGKKTAERLLLELRGKMDLSVGMKGDIVPLTDAFSDIRHALISLGYSEKEATLATRELPADASVSDGIKLALKALSKA